MLVWGYLSYILLGWALLCLPAMQAQPVSALDNLFTAASAVSTTGLVTVDPGSSYSLAGEMVILLLIQLGGIGYMTFGSFVILAVRNRMSGLRGSITRTAFNLPKDFNVVRFVRHVIFFTLACEVVGAVLLYMVFSYHDVPDALWSAIFHSVSAFCTAGFSLNSNSFEGFAFNPYVNLTIAALSYAGAIGFIVLVDLWQTITNQRKHLHFTSKVILEITLWFSLLGTALFYLMEPSVQQLTPQDRLLTSFFQVMTASTTVGFNTVPVGSLAPAVVMVLYFLMVFGASPSGTGGGLKSTTLAALLALIKSTLKRRDKIRYNKREISPERLQIATASLAFYMAVLFVAVIALLQVENADYEVVLFEAISALGTVGLSMGLTAELSGMGKLIIILLMFMGRVGILTFGIAVSTRDESREEEADDELIL